MSKKCLYATLVLITILFLLLSAGTLTLFLNLDHFTDKEIKKVSIYVLVK